MKYFKVAEKSVCRECLCMKCEKNSVCERCQHCPKSMAIQDCPTGAFKQKQAN